MASLLDAGADTTKTVSRGWTALLWAAEKGDAAVVRRLLAAAANPNQPGRVGETPLLIAAHAGHEAVVEQLLASGADVRATVRSWRASTKRERSSPRWLHLGVLQRSAEANSCDPCFAVRGRCARRRDVKARPHC